MFANVSLAKAGHVDKPKVRVGGAYRMWMSPVLMHGGGGGSLIHSRATSTWNSVEESLIQSCTFKDCYLKKIKFPLICGQRRFGFLNNGIKVQMKG